MHTPTYAAPICSARRPAGPRSTNHLRRHTEHYRRLLEAHDRELFQQEVFARTLEIPPDLLGSNSSTGAEEEVHATEAGSIPSPVTAAMMQAAMDLESLRTGIMQGQLQFHVGTFILKFVQSPSEHGSYQRCTSYRTNLLNSGPHAINTSLADGRAFVSYESYLVSTLATLEAPEFSLTDELDGIRQRLVDTCIDELDRLDHAKEASWYAAQNAVPDNSDSNTVKTGAWQV